MDLNDFLIAKAIVMVPVLNIIGLLLKNIKQITNELIPFVLLGFGVGGCLLLCGVSVESAIQGVLVTGAAVFGHQITKQISSLTNNSDK
ncbi:MAG: phage holin family protein [Oscillospiraceae bacterium]|nr:phage holin family protein [Oscillospiraceae bacterium]